MTLQTTRSACCKAPVVLCKGNAWDVDPASIKRGSTYNYGCSSCHKSCDPAPMPFIIPAHAPYPEWSVTIEELLTLGRMRRYGRGGWDTKEDLQLSLMGQYRGRYEYEWVTPDGVKHDFYTEVIKPRIDEIWDWYQVNKQIIKKLHKEQK